MQASRYSATKQQTNKQIFYRDIKQFEIVPKPILNNQVNLWPFSCFWSLQKNAPNIWGIYVIMKFLKSKWKKILMSWKGFRKLIKAYHRNSICDLFLFISFFTSLNFFPPVQSFGHLHFLLRNEVTDARFSGVVNISVLRLCILLNGFLFNISSFEWNHALKYIAWPFTLVSNASLFYGYGKLK
jgi:hypothetical protein